MVWILITSVLVIAAAVGGYFLWSHFDTKWKAEEKAAAAQAKTLADQQAADQRAAAQRQQLMQQQTQTPQQPPKPEGWWGWAKEKASSGYATVKSFASNKWVIRIGGVAVLGMAGYYFRTNIKSVYNGNGWTVREQTRGGSRYGGSRSGGSRSGESRSSYGGTRSVGWWDTVTGTWDWVVGNTPSVTYVKGKVSDAYDTGRDVVTDTYYTAKDVGKVIYKDGTGAVARVYEDGKPALVRVYEDTTSATSTVWEDLKSLFGF